MKKFLLGLVMLSSIGVAAESKDFRENVYVTGTEAAVVYQLALDTVDEIKSARYKEKLPFLKQCNLRSNQYRDNFFFKRKAWTKSSWVSFNHVSGEYKALIKVSCTIRKDRD